MDYYENFIDIVNDYQNIDNKLSGLANQLKIIKNDEVFETKKRTPNDSVTLSTIHISKGLEYKIVFVADLDTSFSKRGYTGELLFTEIFGLSINVEELGQKFGLTSSNIEKLNQLYKYNSILIKLREREEEVRNLYVALTRAENSLHLVSPNGVELNNEKAKDKPLYQALIEDDNFEKILSNLLSDYGEEFIFENEKDALFKDYESEPLVKDVEDSSGFDLQEFYKQFESKQQDESSKQSDNHTIEVKNKVFPAKTSYSALKKINTKDHEWNHKKEKRGYLELTTLKKSTYTSMGILWGNIIHKLFEKIVNDTRAGVEISDVVSYIDSLKKTDNLLQNIKEHRILSQEEFDNINNKDDIEKITNFINSELIKLVAKSEFCQTEIAFTTVKKAKELYDDSESDIDVILQGVVDLFIKISDEEAIIVDYKTDHVTSRNGEEVLRDRHREQLRIYKEAVAEYYKLNSIRTFVYSYVLSSLIEIE